ncbi:cytochrome c oxidase subunit 7A2, mitochondrial-like [Atheta coriaria]|uniref:cytochrome c oxidase subunit 7A2, mitochondrial-like n=1 Tax=Dalotia coriaria TaxID=877792 RepID=UPI0031F37501
MSNLRSAVILGQLIRRQMSTVKEVPSSRFQRLKEVQAKYGVEDGIPSYMKGGFSDRILFGTTLILTAVGLVMSGEVLYKLSYPAKE